MQRVKDGGGRGTEARRIEAAGEQGRGLSPPPAILRGGRQYTHRVAKEARGGGRLEKATVFSPPPRSLCVRVPSEVGGRGRRRMEEGCFGKPPLPPPNEKGTREERGGGE